MGSIYFFAQVVGPMFALPGMVGLEIAVDRQWSATRIILEAQAFSILITLIAARRAWSDFNLSSAATRLFIGSLRVVGWDSDCAHWHGSEKEPSRIDEEGKDEP